MVSLLLLPTCLPALPFAPAAQDAPRPAPSVRAEASGPRVPRDTFPFDPGAFLGHDAEGRPLLCGVGRPLEFPETGRVGRGLPANNRSYSCIPSVIVADGIDSFYLEVDANGPVNGVTLPFPNVSLIPPQPGPLTLVDDGTNGDRIAGDDVYTVGLFTFNEGWPLSPTLYFDPDSPAGLDMTDVGQVVIEETDGSTSTFLIDPDVGVLHPDTVLLEPVTLGPGVQMTPHFVNVRTSFYATGRFLRASGLFKVPDVTKRIYEVLPDTIDHIAFVSIDHMEKLPRTLADNFVAGAHGTVQVNYTGTNSFPFDNSASYGSNGVLLGFNALDNLGRGLFSNNLMHEITHLWAAKLDASFGMTFFVHYKNYSNVASLVGGFHWIDNLDGTYTMDCSVGANGAHQAPPFDRYMAGFLAGSAVPDFLKVDDIPPVPCGQVVVPTQAVTIAQIQALQGVREPGPATSQKHFNLLFVGESNDRVLNAAEMTFYDRLAEHFMLVLPPEAPDPFLGFNWVPGTRFWGPGVTWDTRVPRAKVRRAPDSALPVRSQDAR